MRVAGAGAIGLADLSRLNAIVADLMRISYAGASAGIARLAGGTRWAAGTWAAIDFPPTVVSYAPAA